MALKRTPLQLLMQQAAAESFSFRREAIDTEHVLLAMLKTGGPETEALIRAGANYRTLRKIVEANAESGLANQPASTPTAALRQLLGQASGIARQNGESEVYADYVLFALLNDRESLAALMLTVADVDKRVVYQTLIELLRAGQEKKEESNLSKFGKNLNLLAEQGEIDPVVGRAREINRVIQILSRRTKNNPVLIGEPGVGKTAIAEGLAQRIVAGDVPDVMAEKVIYAIDMATMVAGTKYRGDFEQRLSETIEEVLNRPEVILFIDELHTIIGAGSTEGALDASNILKPALQKGKLRMIGATTVEEYRKRIEKDAALERRFQPVMVEEPTRDQALAILKGIREKYEHFHHVRLSDEALAAAVDLTARYLPDRFLPDKAIDVVDEAMARVHVDAFVIPKEVRDRRRKRAQLEEEKNQAALTQDFERAAALRDEIAALDEQDQRPEGDKEEEAPWPKIEEDQIAAIVAQWAHVPVQKMTQSETARYLHLADTLKKEVIGQDYAVDTVASALKRARVGLKSQDRPIGSFLFVGPTGVGKTYLAKQIAQALFGSEEAMIRIDMSEYMEKYSLSRLLGSAPGYVGYEEGGQLTEQVRTHPYSVVLFDEVEKAHPDIFNVMLQILDDGRLTDSQGRTVDFCNTVIILTSNIGASRLAQTNPLGFVPEEEVVRSDQEKMKTIIQEELKQNFRPEFLNRLDDIVIFHRLSEKSVLQITRLLLDDLCERIGALGYQVDYTDALAQKLAKESYQPSFGARPLERAIRTQVEDLLAEEMLANRLEAGGAYTLALHQGAIVLKPGKKQKRSKEMEGEAGNPGVDAQEVCLHG